MKGTLNNPSQARPKRSKARSEELMLAALTLLAQQDISTVTIKDIAAAAKVNTALIYYYFDSKEHLFYSAVEFAVEQAINDYGDLHNRTGSPADLIHAWFQRNLILSESIRKLVKIMLDYHGYDERFTIRELIDQFYTQEDSILADNIQEGIKLGIFRHVDPMTTSNFVSIHLDGIMVASYIRKEFDIKGAIEDLEAVLWGLLEYKKSN